jgi:hypothetical protein
MKKFTVFLIGASIMVSCGRNNAEQMLYDYQQKNISALNFDLEDLDFKIQKVEKLSDITASDSMKHLKFELAENWTNNPEQTLVDTLSFDFVRNSLNGIINEKKTLENLYFETLLTAIKSRNYSLEFESENKLNKTVEELKGYKETLSKIEQLENRYNEFSKSPVLILSTKYRAQYSLKNPLLGNAKQTFDKVFYSNREQTQFIIEEGEVKNESEKL